MPLIVLSVNHPNGLVKQLHTAPFKPFSPIIVSFSLLPAPSKGRVISVINTLSSQKIQHSIKWIVPKFTLELDSETYFAR